VLGALRPPRRELRLVLVDVFPQASQQLQNALRRRRGSALADDALLSPPPRGVKPVKKRGRVAWVNPLRPFRMRGE
jgi:hypothetical protein